MTITDCMAKLRAYFGSWENEVVYDEVLSEIMRYDDDDVSEIYRELLRGRPAKYGPPDVGAVSGAIQRASTHRPLTLRSGVREDARICPVCKTIVRGTLACCPTCGYEQGTDIASHKEWWQKYQEGKSETPALGKIFDDILLVHSIRQIDKSKKTEATQ